MRTLHVGLRVSDLQRPLAFYTSIGYTIAGTVEGTASGSVTMLRLPVTEPRGAGARTTSVRRKRL
jgi:lactoylglutathione lyase